MARTFLQLVQQAANELGIPEPALLFGSVNDQEKQLISLAIREGKEMCSVANKNGGWQNLHREHTFTTQFMNTTGDVVAGSNIITNIPSTAGVVAGEWGISSDGFENQTRIVSVGTNQVTLSSPAVTTGNGVALSFGRIAYDMPTDFEYFIQKTYWDNKYKWNLLGPISAQEKQVLRYGVIASGPRNKFYVRVNKMWLDPVPSSETLIAYDYLSNNWCQDADGMPKSQWSADTDTYKLDEECFIEGLKWRFLRAKGLDYQEEYNTYVADVNRTMGRDGGADDLALNGAGFGVQFLSGYNVPDTGYGR